MKDVRNLTEDHLHKDTKIDNMDLKTDYELNLSLFAAKEESAKIEPDNSTSHFAFDENLENGVTSAA
jgi:hypothetical protein